MPGAAEEDIVVCIKQILDPEIPVREFRINAANHEAECGSSSLVMDTFSENALETALQFRDRVRGVKLTTLSYGASTAEEPLRKSLAVKADAAVLVLNDGNPHPDSLTTARVLAAAIRKIGQCGLILLGREAGDWGAAQTGGLLAEELGVPYVACAESAERTGDTLRIVRQTDFGMEVIEAQTPVVVSVTNSEHNCLRIPKVRDILMAHRQPLTTWTLAELGIEPAQARAGNAYSEVTELAVPDRKVRCQFAAGSTVEEKTESFAMRIAEVLSTL